MTKKRKAWMIPAGFLLLAAIVFVMIIKVYEDQELRFSPISVLVRADSYSGQGVVFSQNEESAVIVTAGHIFAGMGNGDACSVILPGGAEQAAEVLYLSEVADLAFLQVTESLEEVVAATVDREAFDALKEGDIVRAISFDGEEQTAVEGEILYSWVYLEDFSLDMMLAELAAVRGMSGGAVLDKEGNLVGILCGVSEDGEAAILPLSVILSEWVLAQENL